MHSMKIKRKLVFGVGVNDADYVVSPKINGKQIRCKIYATWVDMLRRCYDESYMEKFPSYIGCTVCSEWLIFSNFKRWMVEMDYNDKHLDKDVIKIGNKVYCNDFCCFVSPRINLLLTDCSRSRGLFKIGVCKVKRGYQSKVQNDGVHEFLGTFKTEEMANHAYIKRKVEIIRSISEKQLDKIIKGGLMRHAKKLEEGLC